MDRAGARVDRVTGVARAGVRWFALAQESRDAILFAEFGNKGGYVITQFKTRAEASQYLGTCGIRCSAATLAKFASVGGGPEMVKFGGRVLYTTDALDRWITQRAIVRRVRLIPDGRWRRPVTELNPNRLPHGDENEGLRVTAALVCLSRHQNPTGRIAPSAGVMRPEK